MPSGRQADRDAWTPCSFVPGSQRPLVGPDVDDAGLAQASVDVDRPDVAGAELVASVDGRRARTEVEVAAERNPFVVAGAR